MDIALSMQVTNLISEGNKIFQGLGYELSQTRTPATLVTKNLLIEGAGELIADLLETKKAKRYGKKVTEAFLEGNIKKNQEAITAKYWEIFERWERNVLSFLQQVSYPATGLTAPGNSHRLIQRIRRANRYKKLETRIQHIIVELQYMQKEGLVYNSSLPQSPPKPKIERSTDTKKVLENLERELRRFIERELGKVSKNWWNERVPVNIRANAENKRTRRENIWPWYPPTSTNVVDYLDFSDYRRIIIETNNWEDVFSQFFKTLSFIEVRLGELEPIRNDLAHSRNITPRTTDKLMIYSEELLECMK